MDLKLRDEEKVERILRISMEAKKEKASRTGEAETDGRTNSKVTVTGAHSRRRMEKSAPGDKMGQQPKYNVTHRKNTQKRVHCHVEECRPPK